MPELRLPCTRAWAQACAVLALACALFAAGCGKAPAQADLDRIASAGSHSSAPREVDLGWRYFERGDRQTALRKFQQAIRHDSTLATAYYGIAYVYSVEGRLDDAIRYYRLTLERDQTNPYTFANLGYALLQNGRSAEALQMLDKALLLKPDCGEAYLSYASYFAHEKQWTRAQQSANRAIECGVDLDPAFRQLLEAHGAHLTPARPSAAAGR
jgi:Tfp pilus assembly protein PilF